MSDGRQQIVSFELRGDPLPWQRTKMWNGRRLTPENQRAYQNALAWACRHQLVGDWDRDGRFAVRIAAFVRRRGQDIDNIAKQVLDSLTGVAWVDDMRVDRLAIERHVDKERPRLEVEIVRLG